MTRWSRPISTNCSSGAGNTALELVRSRGRNPLRLSDRGPTEAGGARGGASPRAGPYVLRVRLFYVDDAGDRSNDPEKPFFVLGGFGIDADDFGQFSQLVKGTAEAHGFVFDHPAELKFSHVGKTKNSERSPNWMIRSGLDEAFQRRALVYSCLDTLLSYPSAEVIVVAVDQRKTYGDASPILQAVTPLFERVNYNCRSHKTQGLVFLDEEQAEDKKLRGATRTGSFYLKFDRIIDAISFMPSEESLGVQMADLIAGSFSRYLNLHDSGYVRRVWSCIYSSDDGVIHGYGLKQFPNGRCPELPAAPFPMPDFDLRVEARIETVKSETWWWRP